MAILVADASQEDRDHALRDAGSHPAEVIPRLGYTEHRPEWVLLRRHVANGQIKPEHLRRMHTDDLEYLAGMTEVSPIATARMAAQYTAASPDPEELSQAFLRVVEEVKVTENAVRATRELERRDARRTQWLVGLAVAFLTAASAIAIAVIQAKPG